MPKSSEIELKLEPRLARLVESGLCEAKDPKSYQRELTELVKRTSGGKNLSSQASFFKALSDETRLRVLYALLSKEMCECEIMAALGLAQPNASHHLSILQRSGVITRTKHGKWVFYKAKSHSLKAMLEASDRF